MSRGNQRDVDRQRAQKRAEKRGNKKKGAAAAAAAGAGPAPTGNAGQALSNRKAHDADIMRQKQMKADGKKDDAPSSAPQKYKEKPSASTDPK